MGQDPSEIKQDIEHTRQEMGRHGRGARLQGRRSRPCEGEGAVGHLSDQRVDSRFGRYEAGCPQGGGRGQENPLGLAIGAAAAGFLAGMLIPSTDMEDDKIGQVADQVKDKVKETGQEAVEHGKQVAQEVAQSAKETAQEKGQEHAQEMKDSAQGKAQETREGVGSSS